MITDKQIEKIVERLTKRVQKANETFLKSIGESLRVLKELSPSEAHQLIQILKYGGKYEEIIAAMSKYTDMNIKDIEEIFEEYAKKDMSFYKKFYEYRNIPYIPYAENMIIQRQTRSLANMVMNEAYNFTRSNVLGYSITDEKGIVKFVGLRETYNKVLDDAFLSVGQGKETFDRATSRIMKEIGSSGLKTINYDSGRSMRLDSAVKMHLKGRLRELHYENQKIIAEEIKADGWEISVHSNPAPDHEPIQGRQFSNEEYQKLNDGLDAKDYKGNVYTLDLNENGSYRPIREMNCKHYEFAIVLGVSEPEYSEKELQEIINDNHEGFEFEGKHYTNYEGTQMQRAIERKIREQKDIQILGKESGNKELIQESQDKIRLLTDKYRELSVASGLKPEISRAKVQEYKRTKVDLQKYYEDHLIGTKNDRYEIKGIANHIVDRSLERKIRVEDLQKAFTNPLDYGKIVYSKEGKPSIKIIGEYVTTYINPETGVLTTLHKTHRRVAKKYGKRL